MKDIIIGAILENKIWAAVGIAGLGVAGYCMIKAHKKAELEKAEENVVIEIDPEDE